MSEDNNQPAYSGTLQTGAKNPKMRKKIGSIVLWQNQSSNPKAPVLCGRIQTNYGSSLVALWKFVPRQKEQAGSSSE
jgi:hypothetical protein